MTGGVLIGDCKSTAKANPIVIYRGIRAQFDEYDCAGRVLHIICPRCTNFGLIPHEHKRFETDETGRLTIFEPFTCDYCLASFRVTDGVMSDA